MNTSKTRSHPDPSPKESEPPPPAEPVLSPHRHVELEQNVIKLNSDVAALKEQMTAFWRALGGATRVP
jgi:hypothetical protein